VTELIWQAREQAAARQVPLQQPGEVAGDASSRATGE
jgi:hypothetical protein